MIELGCLWTDLPNLGSEVLCMCSVPACVFSSISVLSILQTVMVVTISVKIYVCILYISKLKQEPLQLEWKRLAASS